MPGPLTPRHKGTVCGDDISYLIVSYLLSLSYLIHLVRGITQPTKHRAGHAVVSRERERCAPPPASWSSWSSLCSQLSKTRQSKSPVVAPNPPPARAEPAEAPSRSLFRAAIMQVASYSAAPTAVGGAQDVLVVRHSDGTLRSTDWHVVFSALGKAPAEVHAATPTAVPEPKPGPDP